MAKISMLKLAMPYLSLRWSDSPAFIVSSDVPVHPKKDLHIAKSYCVRKSFTGRKLGFISVRYGWIYISHWNHPTTACSVLEIRSAWNYFKVR